MGSYDTAVAYIGVLDLIGTWAVCAITWHNVGPPDLNPQFGHEVIDLLGLSLCRCVFALLVTPSSSGRHIGKRRLLAFCCLYTAVAVASIAVAIAKACTQSSSKRTLGAVLEGWTFLLSLVGSGLVWRTRSLTERRRGFTSLDSSINSGVGTIVDFGDDDSKSSLEKGGASIMRLVQMSSSDAPLLVSATVCLVIAAITNTAIPHFTGKAVDYAAIAEHQHKFHRELAFLGGAVVSCAVFTGLRGAQFSLCIARLKVQRSLFPH